MNKRSRKKHNRSLSKKELEHRRAKKSSRLKAHGLSLPPGSKPYEHRLPDRPGFVSTAPALVPVTTPKQTVPKTDREAVAKQGDVDSAIEQFKARRQAKKSAELSSEEQQPQPKERE